jgi:hypothetical protein
MHSSIYFVYFYKELPFSVYNLYVVTTLKCMLTMVLKFDSDQVFVKLFICFSGRSKYLDVCIQVKKYYLCYGWRGII